MRRIEMSSHLFPECSVHLLGVAPTCHWLEFMDRAAPVLEEPLVVTGGLARLPDRPGVGIRWNEEAVQRSSA
jgi:mandelate racemase